MRYTLLAFIGLAAAAPTPQFDLGALLGGLGGGGGAGGGLDLGALLGGLGGGAGGGGLDLGALASQFLGGGSGPQGDAQVIIDQYNKIKTSVDAMVDFVKSLDKGIPADIVAQLEKITETQVNNLKEAAKAVNAMPGPIPLMSATGLQGPGGDLTVATSDSIDGLKAKAYAISQIPGAKDAEIKNLKAMLEATKSFNEAVNAKLPSIAQSIAQGEAQKSVDFLEDAIKAFENPTAPAPAAAPVPASSAAPAAAATAAAGGMSGMSGMGAAAPAAPAAPAPAMSSMSGMGAAAPAAPAAPAPAAGGMSGMAAMGM